MLTVVDLVATTENEIETPLESKSHTSVCTSCSDLRQQYMTDALVQTYESMEMAGADNLEEYDKFLLNSTRQLPVQDEGDEDDVEDDLDGVESERYFSFTLCVHSGDGFMAPFVSADQALLRWN